MTLVVPIRGNTSRKLAREHVVSPDAERLARAKRAFTTRRVDSSALQKIISKGVSPRSGDLLLARVDAIGQHKRLELPSGRKAQLFPGDEIIVCFGNRYAPDQFEGEVGDDLKPCQLVAAGGIAATVISKSQRVSEATCISPIGLIGDEEGKPVNLADYALRSLSDKPSIKSVAVVGTSMNAGKTTSAAYLVRGLAAAGHRVGTIKLTGTGAGGDLWLMKDAGATSVLDFTDAGFASTYLASVEDLEEICRKLVAHSTAAGCDVIVCELGDGIFQREVAEILRTPIFHRFFSQIVFSASDPVGAVAGVDYLQQLGFRVAAISGSLTQSPLALREASTESDVMCVSPTEFADPAVATGIIETLHEV